MKRLFLALLLTGGLFAQNQAIDDRAHTFSKPIVFGNTVNFNGSVLINGASPVVTSVANTFTAAQTFKQVNKLRFAEQYASVQAALDEAESTLGGGDVRLSSGQYTISRVTLDKQTQLYCNGTMLGNGGGSELIQSNGVNQDFVVTDPTVLATDSQHHSVISNCRLTGGTNTSGSGFVANARTGEAFRLEHDFANGFAEAGFKLNVGTQPGLFYDLHANLNGTYGFDLNKGGSDPWDSPLFIQLSGDNNASGFIRVNGGSGGNVANQLTFLGIKAESSAVGKQPNVMELTSTNLSPINVFGVSDRSLVSTNAVFKVNGTSSARINMGAISAVSASGVTYLVDDSFLGIQIPWRPVTRGIYRGVDRNEFDNQFMYWTGAGAQDQVGLTTSRISDTINCYRMKLGDGIIFGDGACSYTVGLQRNGGQLIVNNGTTSARGDLRANNLTIDGQITAGSGANVITTAAGLVDATKLSGIVPSANLPAGTTKLSWQPSAGAITGTAASATVYSFSIPAGTIPAGGCVRAHAWFAKTGSTSTSYTWTFGATTTPAQTSTNSTSTTAEAIATICAATGSTTSETVLVSPMIIGTGAVSGANATAAENLTSSAITLSFNFNVAATDSLTPRGFLIEPVIQ